MIHELKLREEFVQPILDGDKTFEIRLNDRGFQKGDFVRFTVVEGALAIQAIHQPLKDHLYEITYVLNGFGLEKEFVVFGIRPAKTEEKKKKGKKE